MIYIFWTAPSLEEAKLLSRQVIEKKWAGCVSVIPNALSIYHWNGKIHEDCEVKVIFKTEKRFYEKIRSFVQEEGSYDVFEISMVKVDDANPPYLKWLEDILEN